MTPADVQGKVRELAVLLETEGFSTFVEPGKYKLGSVNIYARRGETFYLICFASDVDRFTKDQLNELKCLAEILRGVPIIVGERNRRGPLDDDVLFRRGNVTTLTKSTFKAMISGGTTPHKFAKQGGFFVRIDGTKLRRVREAKNVSRRAVAAKLDVTKRTIENYERGTQNPSVEKYRQITEMLDEEFCVPASHGEWWEGIEFPRRPGRTSFQNEVGEVFQELGLFPFYPRLSSFDLFVGRGLDDASNSTSARQGGVEGRQTRDSKGPMGRESRSESDGLLPIVSDVEEGSGKQVERRLMVMREFKEVSGERVMLIVDQEVREVSRSFRGIPVMKDDDIRSCRDLRELKKKILKYERI
ncbi:MAG: transcriptional regulator [Promethearchaeota archaeon]